MFLKYYEDNVMTNHWQKKTELHKLKQDDL